jgi:uncharacterized protein
MDDNGQVRFLVDPSLGKLARWLKIMGFDAHYQSVYKNGEMEKLLNDGKILLTKDYKLKDKLTPLILINHNNIKDQLMELKKTGFLPVDRENWFGRCIICNILLHNVQTKDARGRIPDFVIQQNTGEIKSCPKCKRHFWSGSHRVRMIRQLEEWEL